MTNYYKPMKAMGNRWIPTLPCINILPQRTVTTATHHTTKPTTRYIDVNE